MRPNHGVKGSGNRGFQSTHSLRSATFHVSGSHGIKRVSIHALLAECDGRRCGHSGIPDRFQSTHSLRSATRKGGRFCANIEFQSTHSLRSATLWHPALPGEARVSIHALLAECDTFHPCSSYVRDCFNPRTPCGVRLGSASVVPSLTCFNPRTPCGVRQFHGVRGGRKGGVSIHALLAECDRFVSHSA